MRNLSDIIEEAHDGEALLLLADTAVLSPEAAASLLEVAIPVLSAGLLAMIQSPGSLGTLVEVMNDARCQACYMTAAAVTSEDSVKAGDAVLQAVFAKALPGVIDCLAEFSDVPRDKIARALPTIAALAIGGLFVSLRVEGVNAQSIRSSFDTVPEIGFTREAMVVHGAAAGGIAAPAGHEGLLSQLMAGHEVSRAPMPIGTEADIKLLLALVEPGLSFTPAFQSRIRGLLQPAGVEASA